MNTNWNSGRAEGRFLSTSDSLLADASTAEFMARVYRWMVAGLCLTGATAVGVATNSALFSTLLPYQRPLIFVQLAMVFAFSMFAHKVSGAVAGLLFLSYAFLTGVTCSVLFYAYSLGSVAAAFFVTAGAFAALSAYGTLTKKDLSAWRTFLFMGVVGILIATVVNLFVGSSLVSYVVSCAGILVFSGLTAYDTQKIRNLHLAAGGTESARMAISGALVLYLDFLNLFLSILRLFGRRR
jgi:FtsH-binding integral membrane protein